jgi:hypothetical protein
MTFDHEAEVENMGMVFQVMVYALRPSDGAAGR